MMALTEMPERFAAKVMPTIDGCWIWTGAAAGDGFYGYWWDGVRYEYAHRAAYVMAGGVIPPGWVVHHECRQKSCVNPRHLTAMTHRDNLMADDHTQAARNAAKTACKWGHPFDEANTYHHPRGYRRCRACARDQMRRKRAGGE